MRRTIGRTVAVAALMLGTTPAMAQKEDPMAEQARSQQAERDARMLREEAAKDKKTAVVLQANVPVDPTNVWDIDLSSGGHVRIQLRPDVAPQAVERIKTLTRQHFYDGLVFHRVIDGFMAQGGDPKGDGSGGSSLPDLPQEFNWLPHVRGTVAMARAEGEDSANSQFFIMLMPRTQLDHKYTVIGRVIEGMPAVDGIAKGEPPDNPTKIAHATLEADPGPAAPPPPAEPVPSASPPPATPAN